MKMPYLVYICIHVHFDIAVYVIQVGLDFTPRICTSPEDKDAQRKVLIRQVCIGIAIYRHNSTIFNYFKLKGTYNQPNHSLKNVLLLIFSPLTGWTGQKV